MSEPAIAELVVTMLDEQEKHVPLAQVATLGHDSLSPQHLTFIQSPQDAAATLEPVVRAETLYTLAFSRALPRDSPRSSDARVAE